MESEGYRVEVEVPILGRRADLIGTSDTALVAIELKLRDWREALRQAVAYQLAADRVFVAMPLEGATTAYRERWRFQAERVGLLAVDDRGNVRIPVPASPSPRLLPYLRERILAWPEQRAADRFAFAWIAESLASPPRGEAEETP